MMASPFLPTLAELRKSEDCKTRRCIWLTNPRKGQPEQCSRTISDDGKTRQFLQRLKGTDDPRVALADVAALQLCGQSHRAKHIELVLDEWIKKIDEEHLKPTASAISHHPPKSANSPASTPASGQFPVKNGRSARRAPLTQPDPPKPPVVATNIRLTLQIDEGSNLKCHGRTSRSGKCANALARRTCVRIDNIIESLANPNGISSHQSNIASLLMELAPLVLCPRYHQDQAEDLSTRWLSKIADIAIGTKVDIGDSGRGEGKNNPSTPNRKRESSLQLITPSTIGDSPESSIFSRRSRSPQSYITTPNTTPHRSASPTPLMFSPLSYKYHGTETAKLLCDDSDDEDSVTSSQSNNTVPTNLVDRPSSNTRQATLQANQFEPLKHAIPKFLPFTNQNTQRMMKKMFDAISRPLSERDQKFGYIYSFQREDWGYIKIGVTCKDAKKRVKMWGKSCNYEPKSLLEIAVPQAFRVERLIHLELENERCRENLVNGLCNNGTGCPKKHTEWFRVEFTRVEKAVAIWKRFVESEPYDEKHVLKSWWQQQLKEIDLASHLNPWIHWLEPILDRNSAIATGKEGTFESVIGTTLDSPANLGAPFVSGTDTLQRVFG